MSLDEVYDLTHNPFAEADTPAIDNHLGYYTSAFFPKLNNQRQDLRRRRSSLTEHAATSDTRGQKKHTRTPTDVGIVPHITGLHPLKSALAGKYATTFNDLDVTRPHLSRIVNEGALVDAPEPASDGSIIKFPKQTVQEKDVIVHEVSLKDSLAGVSLKYGISLANLRRANQLWANDSIHRRSVLYIPIEEASRAKAFIPELSLISLDATPHQGHETTDMATFTFQSGEEIAETNPSGPSVPILRIPAKQLSFFPPSSTKHLDTTARVGANTPVSPGKGNSKLSPGLNRYTGSPTNSSLTSILTALPIAASTRDEIITRLSFDSVSSSFSERSSTNSEEEHGHELDDVTKRNPVSGPRHPEDIDEMSTPTPKAAQMPSRQASTGSSSSHSQVSHKRSLSSTSPPRFYVSQINETYVRTSQLEPSPSMQLPPSRVTTLGRTRGKTLKGKSSLDRPFGSLRPNGNSTGMENEMGVLGKAA